MYFNTYSKKHRSYQRYEKVESWKKVDILHEKSYSRRSLSFFVTEFFKKSREGKLKEIHLHQDPRSSNLVILEALEKYGVKTWDILPPPQKKECKGKTLTEENHWPSNKRSIHIE